jgi:starvation-inducible DNA-binding protein
VIFKKGARRSVRSGCDAITFHLEIRERKNNVIHTNNKNASGPSAGTGRGLPREGVVEIGESLRHLLADVFTLYLKTKNFHWHMAGPHFRDYHLLLDEHADQIFAMTDGIAERARKIGTTTLHSIGDVVRHQRIKDNEQENPAPHTMLNELRDDNERLTEFLRDAHEVCARSNDVATTSLIEVWIDETERRAWFLRETVSGFPEKQRG